MSSPSRSCHSLQLPLRFLKIVLALFSLVLLITTWQLWVPQTLFPQVPLFSWILILPAWLDWLTFLTMVVSAVCILGIVIFSILLQIRGRELWYIFQQVCGGLFFTAFLISILFDQHRIQPWAYQFAISFLLLLFLKPQRAISVFRLFVISIYFFSALSKCDASFVQTLGRHLVDGLFTGMGLSTAYWSEQSLTWIAASFPVAELLVALGLFIPRTRRWALWAAVLMHVCLIIAVGPWGLNHHQGVIIWNIYFIVQDLMIFGPWFERTRFQESSTSDTGWSLSLTAVSGSERGVLLVAWFAMSAPFLEPMGYFDHWPAWGLYSSHHDRVTLLVDARDKSSLPPSLQPFVDSPQPLSRWSRVRLDRWSLAELGVPIYPQARFQCGVALAVGRVLEHGMREKKQQQPQVKLLYEGAANRFTGKRKMNEYSGLKQIEQFAEHFRFNALPRPVQEAENSNLFY